MKNPNRFLRVLIASLFVLSAFSAAAETAIDQMYAARKYDLADAYYQAGQKFIELGQQERGDEFIAAAKKIFPGYQPGHPPMVKAPEPTPTPTNTAPVTDPLGVPERPQVTERNVQAEKIVRLQFFKLMRGVLSADSEVMRSVMADELSMQDQKISADEAIKNAEEFYKTNPTLPGSPDEIFDLSSLTIEPYPAAGTGAQKLTVRTQNFAGSEGPFSKPNSVETLIFIRVGNIWKLSAIE